MLKTASSPCLQCSRVKNPELCENKQCQLWQRWFLRVWEQTRQQYKNIGIVAPAQPLDPCASCRSATHVCRIPCRRKRAWYAARKELAQ